MDNLCGGHDNRQNTTCGFKTVAVWPRLIGKSESLLVLVAVKSD